MSKKTKISKCKQIKEAFNRYKMYILCITIIILSIISVVIQSIDRKNSTLINSQKINGKNGKIAVYITGEIKSPGVYYLNENSRLSNLLDLCGGITESADIENINLAKKLVDSDKINIPKKQEKIDIADKNDEDDTKEETIETEKNIMININTATKDELMSLEGIGESTAEKIIEYRKIQTFLEIEDIMNVSGIGKSKYDKIKNKITVN